MEAFFALDVETSCRRRASICSLAIVEFQDRQVIKEWSTYVDPEDIFEPMNCHIHHIDASMVRGAPKFPKIYDILKLVGQNGSILTHTAFDLQAICAACNKYNLPELNFLWLDSAEIARKQWPQFQDSGYKLSTLAKSLGITYQSHIAVEDARTAGQVFIHAMSESGLSLEDWKKKIYFYR
jgi:DNA polymerase-3 subunit epsilon